MGYYEIIENGGTAAAREQAWHSPLLLEFTLFQQLPKSFTTADVQFL
jgi:hypothetical protein